jgi:hypothetical protein
MLESLVAPVGTCHTCDEALAKTFFGTTPIEPLVGEEVSRQAAVDATARHHDDCLVASTNAVFREENIEGSEMC